MPEDSRAHAVLAALPAVGRLAGLLATPPAGAPPPSRRRVLVVDDEPDILDTLPDALREMLDEPLQVETARSGEEARAKLEESAYDLVVTDERMPGLRGSELLEWLRRERPGTARVLMSAYADVPPGRSVDLPRSAQLFLRKPFQLDKALPQLRDLLAKRPGNP